MGDSMEPGNKKIKLEYADLEGLCTAEMTERSTPLTTSYENNETLLLDFPGPCGFGYYFSEDYYNSLVSSWLFSELLNQAFIKMGNVMHVHFFLDESKAPTNDLYIRATPVYCSADHMHLPVSRCTLHSLEDDPTNESHKDGTCRCSQFKNVGHVIRSTSAKAMYSFDPVTERHSVLVPVNYGIYDLLFMFTCKSSCARGMERRPIRVVFSLEDVTGLVLGRCSLNVKICSCPKRDKDRGEKEFRLSHGERSMKKRNSKPSVQDSSVNGSQHHSLFGDMDPLAESAATLDQHMNGHSDDRISKLKTELLKVQSYVMKLNELCSSIEHTLNSLDSDI